MFSYFLGKVSCFCRDGVRIFVTKVHVPNVTCFLGKVLFLSVSFYIIVGIELNTGGPNLATDRKFKRVIIKLSGEALAGEKGYGIDPVTVDDIAAQIQSVREAGLDVAVVNGGGNIWRGLAGSSKGMDRATADYMGMLATIINSLALQDALETRGVATRVQTAIEMRQIAEPYIRRRAIRHLEKGRVVIFAAGTGNPYFSTDTTAALRAAEIEADAILMAKKGVDGVYDSDPNINRNAKKFDHLEYIEVIQKNLKVMDSTAISLCMDNKIPIVVFNIDQKGNILRAAKGEKIGTLVGGL